MSISNKTRGKIFADVIGASIGNVLEWFDFGVYGFFAIVISSLMFPESPATALLLTFLVFGIGFVFRPLGSIFFAHIGDKVGRKNALLLTFWLMGFATIFTGLIPTYSSIGIAAPVLLALLRIIQGFGAGGEWGGVGSYLSELGGEHRRAFFGSFQQVFILLSLLAGSLTGLAVTSLSHSFVYSIGWRLPFIVGGLILLPVAAVLRRKLPESEVFTVVKEKKETVKFPIVKAFTEDLKPTSLVLFGTIIWTVSFYILLAYLPTYLKETTSLTLHEGFIVTSVGIAALVIFVPLWGYLSDRFQTRKLFALVGSVAFIVLPYPLFVILHGGVFLTVIVVVVIMDFFIAFLSGVLVAWFAESFPTNDRYTGFVPYNISTAYFGGFAPFIASYLISATGNPISPVFYVIFAGIVSTIAFLIMIDTAKLKKLPETESIYKNRSTVTETK